MTDSLRWYRGSSLTENRPPPRSTTLGFCEQAHCRVLGGASYEQGTPVHATGPLLVVCHNTSLSELFSNNARLSLPFVHN